MTLNADTGCGGGGTVSFVDRRERVTSSGKKILICRPPGSGEPGPGTTAYVTPTHSHRRSCPAPPSKPGPGAAAGCRGESGISCDDSTKGNAGRFTASPNPRSAHGGFRAYLGCTP